METSLCREDGGLVLNTSTQYRFDHKFSRLPTCCCPSLCLPGAPTRTRISTSLCSAIMCPPELKKKKNYKYIKAERAKSLGTERRDRFLRSIVDSTFITDLATSDIRPAQTAPQAGPPSRHRHSPPSTRQPRRPVTKSLHGQHEGEFGLPPGVQPAVREIRGDRSLCLLSLRLLCGQAPHPER